MPNIQQGKPNLDVFCASLMELAAQDRDIFVVTSDSRGSAKLAPFCEKFPDRVVEVGIAEQSLVGVAAGMGSSGKKVFVVSPASFLTARALEQIKADVAYSDIPVVLIGISAGVSYGALGSTHHSLHDIAALRAVNNIDIFVPADNFETREAVRAAAARGRPAYIRLGKRPMPHIHAPETRFSAGEAILVRDGHDGAFIATGETVHKACQAAEILNSENIRCRVVSMHTIRPLDTAAILDAASACGAVITVEEHMVHGGLGEACASALMQAGAAVPFKIAGIPDEYTVTGSQEEIFGHYGLCAAPLADAMRALLKRRGRTAAPQPHQYTVC